MTRCKTCGTPLDEIPFEECKEHQEYERKLPPLTAEEEDLINNQPPFEGEY